MTNKEMIIELRYTIDLIKQNGQDWLDERDIPILEAAISALQAQDVPDTNVGDMISRQAAIDALELQAKEMFRWAERYTEQAKGVLTAKNVIEDLPFAQPRQTDCGYCHEDFDGYVRPINKNSHAWLVRRGRTMKLRVCFKGGYSECDILFCPMCGRRFTDG